METMKLPRLLEYFRNIEDPRRETKNKKYPLIEVIVIAFLAVMSGADGWESIERYGVMREKWLRKFLDLTEGIAKHDVYRRVFGAIKSELLESCFMNGVRDIKQNIKQEGDSDRRKDRARDGDPEPFQSGDGGTTDTSGKRMGDGKPAGVCPGTDGRKKQQNNGDTYAFGTDSDSRLYQFSKHINV